MFISSKEIARAAIMMSMTQSREEERRCREELLASDILSAAVDCGGDYISSVNKFIERAIVAAKREGVVKEGQYRRREGVAGAAHEALSPDYEQGLGLSVGGKIGIARKGGPYMCGGIFRHRGCSTLTM